MLSPDPHVHVLAYTSATCELVRAGALVQFPTQDSRDFGERPHFCVRLEQLPGAQTTTRLCAGVGWVGTAAPIQSFTDLAPSTQPNPKVMPREQPACGVRMDGFTFLFYFWRAQGDVGVGARISYVINPVRAL